MDAITADKGPKGTGNWLLASVYAPFEGMEMSI